MLTLPIKTSVISFVLILAAVSAFSAETFYVNADPSIGNDSYDGRAAVWDGEHGPIRTLANITNLVTATSKESTEGDTVYVAEGDYNFGSTVSGAYRAEVPNGTRLVGVGDRNKIRIFGNATDEKQTVPAAGGMRALNVGKWSLVKNMTLCNGRMKDGSGGAAVVDDTSYLVGCVISNNYVQYATKGGRGGALTGGVAIRCLFVKNASSYIGECTNGGSAYNCIFVGNADDTYLTYDTYLYNCTFIGGNSPRASAEKVSYNSLFRIKSDSSNKAEYGYSLFTCKMDPVTLRGGCQDSLDAETQLKLDFRYVPVASLNLGIDAGSNDVYEVKFPKSALVADQKYLDFNGNPRILGSAIDIGACELDPDERRLSIVDAQTALVVTGATKGERFLSSGESVTFTLARNYSTTKLCTGVNVNGAFHSFTGTDADLTHEFTIAYGDATGSLDIQAVYAEHNDWYVDASAPDDRADGYVPYRPKRTLAGAMTNALVASGDTVHAAPGIYREGTMTASATSYTTNRVIVKAGVTLVADQGREVTAIEGFIPEKAKWNGTDMIRCALLESGAVLRGFTVRNGMVPMDQVTAKTAYGGSGGGISGGTAVDCVVSNCYAVRGGGVTDAVLIRCRVVDNDTIPSGTKNANGGSASSTAAAMMSGSAYDSYFSGYAMNLSEARNCTFTGNVGRNGDGSTYLYNCYVGGDSGFLRHRNSVLKGRISPNSTILDDYCASNTTLKVDAKFRPDRTDQATAACVIDRGNAGYYVYPTAVAAEAGKDYAGGQRIYNGRIDVGCGEYDWRGDFTQQLKTRGVDVAAAGANVTTNDLAGLVMSDGDTLKLKLTLKADGKGSFSLVTSDEGSSATVTLNGAELVGEEGVYRFDGVKGESKLEISFAGEGTAMLSDVVIPKTGVLLLVR